MSSTDSMLTLDGGQCVNNNKDHKSSKKKKKTKSSSVKSAPRKSSVQPACNLTKSWQSDQNVAALASNGLSSGINSASSKQPDRRRSQSLCRITGLSHSLDEPHYFPSKSDFPYFGRRGSCHITYGHEVLGDNYHFPIFDPKGKKEKQDKSSPIKCDLSENPSQLLKQKFKQKNWISEDEKSIKNGLQSDEPPRGSKSLKKCRRKSSLTLERANPAYDKSSSTELVKSVDVNNNLVEQSRLQSVKARSHSTEVLSGVAIRLACVPVPPIAQHPAILQLCLIRCSTVTV